MFSERPAAVLSKRYLKDVGEEKIKGVMTLVKMGYFTAQEVADMLKINKITLYRWEAAGKIPKARRHPMNKYRVYTKEDVGRTQRIINKGIK